MRRGRTSASKPTSGNWSIRRSASHRGRTVKNTGDGRLAEFASEMPPCSCARRLRCLICLDGGAGKSARRRGRCSWLAARAVDWLVHGSRHRRNPRVSSSLLGGRMRVSSCDPATGPIRPRLSYRTLNQHHLKRNRKFVDSPLEEDGFEPSVPRGMGRRYSTLRHCTASSNRIGWQKSQSAHSTVENPSPRC